MLTIDACRRLTCGRRTSGRFELDGDLAEDALRIALAVPDGEYRLRPGAAFRPGLPAPENPAPLDRILTALGRSPDWPG